MNTTCLSYHDTTSYDRSQMGGHVLDWANQPVVYKTYPGIEPLRLSKQVELPQRPLSMLLLETGVAKPAPRIDPTVLSKIFLLSYTLTAKTHTINGDFYYRSAASAGALYPSELYVACQGVAGIDDGLFHYDIRTHGLVPLRTGRFATGCPDAAGSTDRTQPAATFFLTAVFFRSAWKYRARAYRYHLMDTGHVAENLTLALIALGLGCHITYDFDDDRVNHLLGLDARREVALGLVCLPGGPSTPETEPATSDSLPQPVLEASRVAAGEVDYPVIRQLHDAGKKKVPAKGHGVKMVNALGLSLGPWRRTQPGSAGNERAGYPQCVFLRRSRRNFIRQPVSKEQTAGLLHCLTASDRESAGQVLAAGFLSGQVEEMAPGFWLLDREHQATCRVAPGDYLAPMAHICLDQAWLANAGVHFLFMANLALLDQLYGPRGYRYAMMTAGRLGQRLYLAATAMGLGCCGIGAFYDAEAKTLLGLSQPSRLLYLVAVGAVK